eukprot:3831343-Pleurochrysis_carterae.AAC.1
MAFGFAKPRGLGFVRFGDDEAPAAAIKGLDKTARAAFERPVPSRAYTHAREHARTHARTHRKSKRERKRQADRC